MEKSPGLGAGWRDSSKESASAHFWPRRKCRTSQRRMSKVTCFGMLLCCSPSLLSLWVSHLIKQKKQKPVSCFSGASGRLGTLSGGLIVAIQKGSPSFPLNLKIFFSTQISLLASLKPYMVNTWESERSILWSYANQLVVWRGRKKVKRLPNSCRS